MVVDLAIPPGLAQNGTKYQNRGRWVDANLVRFAQGTVRPVGGWDALRDLSNNAQTVTGMARTVLAWTSTGNVSQLAIGTHNKLFAWSLFAKTDITPSDLVAGNQDSGATGGTYGSGNYGTGNYGYGSGTTQVYADVWHLDTYGDNLIACLPSDGRILRWDRNIANDAALIDADAPTACWGVVVTPERFIVALGADGDRRKIEWCNQEDYATWDAAAPAAGSQAGDWILDGEGSVMAGRRAAKETLIWTTAELFTMRYIGGVFVYSIEKLGSDCGLIAPNAVAMIGTRAVWMGSTGFYIYDGYVRPLPCEVQDAIFSDFERSQAIKVNSFTLSDFNEVWWLYPSAGSMEPDTYVVWNWEENHWTRGTLDRTAGCDRGPFVYPFMVSSGGSIYEHERGYDHGSSTLFIESAPMEVGDGDRLSDVTGLIPDEKTRGDVKLYAYTSMYPTAAETLRGPYSMANPTNVRWTARQLRIRLEQNVATDWRYGVLRLDVRPGSRR